MAGRTVQAVIDVLERRYEGDPKKMPYIVNKEALLTRFAAAMATAVACSSWPMPPPSRAQGGAAAVQARLLHERDGGGRARCLPQGPRARPSPDASARVEATLASRLAALERWDEVVEVYRGAVSRRPADGPARIRLGAALLHMQDRAAEAEPELHEAVRLRPEDAEARVLLGNALALLGRPADAVGRLRAGAPSRSHRARAAARGPSGL